MNSQTQSTNLNDTAFPDLHTSDLPVLPILLPTRQNAEINIVPPQNTKKRKHCTKPVQISIFKGLVDDSVSKYNSILKN